MTSTAPKLGHRPDTDTDIGYGRRMRDGTPLPGRTSAQVLSQLAHRVFGPLHPTRIRIVLDYHGLIDQPAGALIDIAHRHRVTTRTVSNNAATVRAAGLRLPLPATLIVEASRASAPFDDHLGRARIAATLGLPTPDPAPVNKRTPLMGEVQAGHLTAARAAMRVIAAIGPLDLPTLAAGIARSRRFRTRNPLSDSDLADALTTAGCTPDPAGRWHPPAGVVAPDRYQRIVTLAAGRDLTRAEMIDILITAGYRESSASGRLSSSHPLFRYIGPDRYRLVDCG
jgi:hypothetical protein